MKILCSLGLHKWKMNKHLEQEYNGRAWFLESGNCLRCGRFKKEAFFAVIPNDPWKGMSKEEINRLGGEG